MPVETGSIAGQVGGVGLWVAQLFEDDAPNFRGALVVLHVLSESLAARDDIRPSDRITHVGGVKVRGLPLAEVVLQHLRGPAASRVQLTLERSSQRQRFDVEVERIPLEVRPTRQAE
jgi:C-terminal processing protease CtpA/Prc